MALKPVEDLPYLLDERSILAPEGRNGYLPKVLAGGHAASCRRLSQEPLVVESLVEPARGAPEECKLVL